MPTGSGRYATITGQNTGYVIINGVYSEIGPSDYSYNQGHWSRTSTNTPGYFKGHRAGVKNIKPVDLPMNDFTFENERTLHSIAETKYERFNVSKGEYYLKVEQGLFQENVIIPSRSTADFLALDNKAKTKLLTDLKDQSVNAAVVIAEGRKTLEMIADTARSLAIAGVAVKRGNFAGAAHALGVPLTKKAKKQARTSNSVASNWLALQYGWLPLMSDIYGAAQHAAKALNYHPRTRITSSSSKTDAYRRSFESPPRMFTDSWTTKHTVKYVVYFTERGGGNPPTALGLTNPLAVAWELVPFSFVIDWFLPVGTFLNNIDATLGLDFVKGCRTEFWKAQSFRHVGPMVISHEDGSIERFQANHRTVCEIVYCERRKITSFPLSPVPSFKNPLSGMKGGYKHELNAMALISQVFR